MKAARLAAGAAGAAAWLAAALVASCGPRPSAPPASPASRGPADAPYRLGTLWYYPREEPSLVESGLASVAPDTRAGRATASGEPHDPATASAAHRTVLPLPAVLRVTNLETGRELLLRANDRGPRDPGRVVELSRRAAELLGVAPGRPAQVRVAVEPMATRAVAAASGAPGSSAVAVATAPTGRVEREALAPPPGAVASTRVREAAPAPVAVASADAGSVVPVTLGERVATVPAAPGRLFVQAGTFESAEPARRQAARLPGGARAEASGASPRAGWRVRLGPFATPAEADAALERVLATGVSESRIVVD